ncbi:MAG: beta-lactamase family protein [Kiritimatiellae bacterium]|nr:beta-lactamase family protein [Kiritimatiellia bacterium]
MKRSVESKLESAFDLVETAVSCGILPGAGVLVMHNGEVLLQQAYGLCDVENRRAFTPETIGWIASITKPVTAAAAMRLVEDGKLTLDDPVAKYLPEFARREDGRLHHTITVRHLLTHTSGLPVSPPLRKRDVFDPFWYSQKLEETIPSIAEAALAFAPGTEVEYSNSAYYVLGRVIEVAAGRPYEAYVKEVILDPLGMNESYYPATLPAAEAARIAVVYRANRQRPRWALFRYDPSVQMLNSLPDGGLFCTARNLAKFYQMFVDNDDRVLSKQSVEAMLSEQVPGRGLGWSRRHGGLAHGGSSGAFGWADPPAGLVGILLFQFNDFGSVQRLRSEFVAAVRAAFGLNHPSPAFAVPTAKPWAFEIGREQDGATACKAANVRAELRAPSGRTFTVQASAKDGQWVAHTTLDEEGVWQVTTSSNPPLRRLASRFWFEASAGRPNVPASSSRAGHS